MRRALPLLLLALPLAGCGGGVQMGIGVPTEVQAGVASSGAGGTRAVGRVTGWEPWVIYGAEEDENDQAF